jgi:hypothetical protein
VQDGEFRFRHALTREAIAADVLPPTRTALATAALDAFEAAHPGLGPEHRDTAADLAVQADQAERAGLLLIETGLAALQRGALATAGQTFSRAASLLGASAGRNRAEFGLLEALALAGLFEEAMTVGNHLIARLGGGAARVHLRLAHAAVAATRWAAAHDQRHRTVRGGSQAVAATAAGTDPASAGSDPRPADTDPRQAGSSRATRANSAARACQRRARRSIGWSPSRSSMAATWVTARARST